jgi:hypothetical protein
MADPLSHLGGVAIDVADGGIDLGEGYAHTDTLPCVRARRLLLGAALASLALAVSVPSAAPAVGKPFIEPLPRPTEAARPTDKPDPNRNAYTVPEAPRSPACTRNFCVHWVAVGIDAPSLTDGDGDGIPDFVGRVQRIAERVHAVQNGKHGWREPKSDGRKGGGRGKTDIYLTQMGGSLFGYAAPDRNQARRGARIPRRLHGYLVLDNDYDPFEFPGTKVDEVLDVTLAHEYNHILQFGYDAYQDPWFAESSAVWMEDQVFNGIDDYLRYVRRWVHHNETPLTARSVKQYGSTVWNQWLARRYGRSIVRKAWARAIRAKPGGFSIATYDTAIHAAGRSDFSRDFARFARDVAEWRTGSIFREGPLFPDVRRQGALPGSGKPSIRSLDHTTFQLLRVAPHKGRAVVVNVTAPRGSAAGVALVGRIGTERHGRVISRLRYKRGGCPGRGASIGSLPCSSTRTGGRSASARAGSTGTT